MTVREGLHIEISGIPAENGKCRVETQLKIGFHLKDAQGGDVLQFKQLRLPHPLIAKEKHRMEKYNGRNKDIPDSGILTLEAKLVCDHDMTKILETCDNCIGRERKRAHRRKETQRLPGQLSSIPIFGAVSAKNGAAASLADEPIQPTPTDPIEYQAWERKRIMVFSNTEYVDLTAGQCLLPTRITCYCRHHNEKVGFRIQFTARDSTGSIVASVLTHPVMMMDDHKSGKKALPSQPRRTSAPKKIDKPASLVTKRNSQSHNTQEEQEAETAHTHEHEQDMDQHNAENENESDNDSHEEQDDGDMNIDLEAGTFIHRNASFRHLGMETEVSSGEDKLSPLAPPDRMGSKRRVMDGVLDDFQMHSVDESMRGPFRRKTSHDVSVSLTSPSCLASSATMFPSLTSSLLHPLMPTPVPAPSPFIPGSTLAQDEGRNQFPLSLTQATATSGSFLDQSYMNMFLNLQRNNCTDKGPGLNHNQMQSETSPVLQDFTTLNQSMTSSHGLGRPSSFLPATLPSKISSTVDLAARNASSALPSSRASMAIPAVVPQPSVNVPWATGQPENKDPYRNMRAGFSQTTSPSSSAFIPTSISTTWSEDAEDEDEPLTAETETEIGELPSTANSSSNASASLTSAAELPLLPKKRGRPRKGTSQSLSQRSSPVLTHKPLSPSSTAPSSPLLRPLSELSATEIILLQHRQQQQQLQHHQQQLQQQQKQAILARQKPRVQKLIPSRGTVEGGSEVTLLGSGFYPGMAPGALKAGTGLGIAAAAAAAAAVNGKDDANSTDLVRTMAQFFGGPSSQPMPLVGDDDVGVLFEYEESKGDHDLLALALQVLGMKMSGRVEPPHQVAMRIMGTAAASNAIMGQGQSMSGSGPLSILHQQSSSETRSTPSEHVQQQQQQELQQSQQRQQQQQLSFLQFTNIAQATAGFGASLASAGQQVRSEPLFQQQRPILSSAQSLPLLTHGSILTNGHLGYNGFLTSMGGPGNN
ncbi:hypothetical protein BGZ94_001591 [Podila epigama]|nr:hypothetical protein BGZ94_001591 [Podila epigama]